jgi:hypothetical protein
MSSETDREPRYEDNSYFNQWFDEQYDGLEVEEGVIYFSRSASEILFEMDKVAYETALNAFLSDQLEALKQSIFENFPSPVAYYFYRADRGSENSIQRLHFLRDTWEALVFLLYAIVMGEARFVGVPLDQASIRMRDIRSDRLSTKLRVMREVLQAAQRSGIVLHSRSLITEDLLQRITDLNRVRNGFSHSAALSTKQAQELFTEYLPEVMSVLQSIGDLENITLMRFAGNEGDDIHALNCEVFSGFGLVKEFRKIQIEDQQLAESGSCLNRDNIIVANDDRIYSLSPFVHFQEDEAGHHTELCFYKRVANDPNVQDPPPQYEFERVGVSQPVYLERVLFEEAMQEFRTLLGVV